MSSNFVPGPAFGAPPPKKSHALLWVLTGCGAIIIVVVLVASAGAYWAYHKARQVAKDAGLDPEQMQKHPAVTAIKLITAMNPDIEVVSVDEDKNRITLRDKKSGKTVTMNLDEAEKGKIVISQDGEGEVTVEASNGNVEVKSKDGNAKFGGGAPDKIPQWVPAYPEVAVEGYFSVTNNDGESGGFHFTTKDSTETVVSFYQDKLKGAGMKVTSNSVLANGANLGQLAAEDQDAKRKIVVIASKGEKGTETLVTFESKK
jgi:hypothetical protein